MVDGSHSQITFGNSEYLLNMPQVMIVCNNQAVDLVNLTYFSALKNSFLDTKYLGKKLIFVFSMSSD